MATARKTGRTDGPIPARKRAAAPRKQAAAAPARAIEHVFVLMLENRSFDHLFGLGGLPGVAAPPPGFGFRDGAPDALSQDPPHEYDDVIAQMAGGAMTGFPQHGGPNAMKGFGAGTNPVLNRLARTGLLMDNWFSSVPGPTWPNRFFAHAASSGGLDNSPGAGDIAQAVSSPLYSYKFDGGHVFDRLVGHGRSWRVYRGDTFPQVLSLRGMVDKRLDRQFFRSFTAAGFRADLARGYNVAYTFIEPNYDSLRSFRNGNSQHPLGSVSSGERLIDDVYQAIFRQAIGTNSVLLVTWDEHGGFFDHVRPPVAVPPGDSPLNYRRASLPRNCRFDQLGPRVPALLLSPWLPQGLGSQVFPGTAFDHASIVSSLREIFALGAPLTRRDAAAPSWHSALLTTPRPMDLTRGPRVALKKQAVPARKSLDPASPSILGTLEIAIRMDWDLAARTQVAPLIATSYAQRLSEAVRAAGNSGGVPDTPAHRKTVLDYLEAVGQRELALQRKVNRQQR
jgi:phospholipase C